MAIPLNDNTRILAPKPSDPRYFAPDNTPWASIVAAEAGLPLTERHEGLTVNIAGVEYWWKDGEWAIYKPTPSLQTVLNVGNESTTNIILQTTDTIPIETYSENNIGVYGSSNDSIGVLGNSGEGVGVQGYSLNNIGSVFNLGASNTNNITEWRKANQKVASISYDGKFTAKKSIKIDSDEPLDAKYLNGKLAYASLDEANSLIPIGIRSPYLTIVVQGAEYWWKDGAWVVKSDSDPKFKSLETYQEMLDYHTPSRFLLYEILNDEDKSYNRSTYLWKPDGNREWIASTPDNEDSLATDYLEKTVIFKTVTTYALMIAQGNPILPTVYSVENDENKSYERSTYLWKPNGNREWIATTQDN